MTSLLYDLLPHTLFLESGVLSRLLQHLPSLLPTNTSALLTKCRGALGVLLCVDLGEGDRIHDCQKVYKDRVATS